MVSVSYTHLDVNGVTLASASSVDMKLENGSNIAAATAVGKAVGEAAIAKNSKDVYKRQLTLYYKRKQLLLMDMMQSKLDSKRREKK